MNAASMRYARRILASLALVASAAPALTAQETGVLTGTVIDRTTSMAVEGVTIRIVGTAYGASTRANGQFALLQVPPGIYSVEATVSGYDKMTVTGVDVRADINRVLNFSLIPNGEEVQSLREAARSRERQIAEAMDVRLFTLEHLSNADAAKLVAPFVRQPVEGVFDPGNAVRGVTVRASPATLARIDSLLGVHDRRRPTIVLRFQVIAASDSALRDPLISNELQSALREELSFAGYRNLAQAQVATVAGENDMFSLVMDGAGEQMRLMGGLTSIGTRVSPQTRATATRAPEVLSASVSIHLRGLIQTPGQPPAWDSLISTSLNIPIGQTVVIGNATSRNGAGGRNRTLILVVRAEAQ